MGIKLPRALVSKLIDGAIEYGPRILGAIGQLVPHRNRARQDEDPRPAVLDRHCPEYVPLSLSPRIPRCIYCKQILSDDVAAQPCPGVVTA